MGEETLEWKDPIELNVGEPGICGRVALWFFLLSCFPFEAQGGSMSLKPISRKKLHKLLVIKLEKMP